MQTIYTSKVQIEEGQKEKKGFGIHDQRTTDCVMSFRSNIRVD